MGEHMRDTIDMAREAGFKVGPSRDGPDEVRGAGLNLRWFEALVRADEREICTNAAMAAAEEAVNFAMALEREACAKVCDDLLVPVHISLDNESLWEAATLDCADAIRARGEAK